VTGRMLDGAAKAATRPSGGTARGRRDDAIPSLSLEEDGTEEGAVWRRGGVQDRGRWPVARLGVRWRRRKTQQHNCCKAIKFQF
jgi:hypothetical protein